MVSQNKIYMHEEIIHWQEEWEIEIGMQELEIVWQKL